MKIHITRSGRAAIDRRESIAGFVGDRFGDQVLCTILHYRRVVVMVVVAVFADQYNATHAESRIARGRPHPHPPTKSERHLLKYVRPGLWAMHVRVHIFHSTGKTTCRTASPGSTDLLPDDTFCSAKPPGQFCPGTSYC